MRDVSGLARAWSRCERVLHAVRTAGHVAAKLALAGIVVSYTIEVVGRYFFNAPTWWSAELVSYLLCILAFTMMPYVTATKGQIAISVLLELLAPSKRVAAERFIALVGAAMCAAMAYFAADETGRQIVRNVQMMAAYPIPKWWVSSWIVVGFGASALEFALMALKPAGVDVAPAPAAAKPVA